MLRRYVHGAAVDDPIAWYEGAGLGQRRSLHSDHQGSIVAVADSTANIIKINGYDAWGVPNAGANANLGRFQFTGQIWLPEIGMYHYKARIYSPTLGRFLQTDPVGYDGGINLYGYAGNDPVNAADPSGLTPVPSAVPFEIKTEVPVPEDYASRRDRLLPPAHIQHNQVRGQVGDLLREIRVMESWALQVTPGKGQNSQRTVQGLQRYANELRMTPRQTNKQAQAVAAQLGYYKVAGTS